MDLTSIDEEISLVNVIEAEEDPRDHLSIIFIGHVDHGKSTVVGQTLYLSGKVDQQSLKKNEKEAKELGRDGWIYAFFTDSNEEERAKGITIEVGRAYFQTKAKRYTILDAPGHKNYVPNMIGAAAQADVAMLVISARKGEFETGFSGGGQTREHAILAKTLGVNHLVVVVNKMDDPTVQWDKARWDQIVGELTPFLKATGYDIKNNVKFVPISGMKGVNMVSSMDDLVCPWYHGKSMVSILDDIIITDRMPNYPVRIPVIDKIKDGGKIWAMGKIESGILTKGQSLTVVPNNIQVEVTGIMLDDVHSFRKAKPGENVRLSIKGISDDNQLKSGFMLCDPKFPVVCQKKFEAQIMILELPEKKSLFSAGYTAVIHIHTAVEEIICVALLDQLDKKTRKSIKKKPDFVKTGEIVRCILETVQPICLELYDTVHQLGFQVEFKLNSC
eukprot:TRINITY_DN2610_c0_g1_i3.p1 TRINITY_DN2610_c0_g1~~TRINITY_DN2610_c0_g1_i3.p1  ORF type:complete len:445 (-),score=172.30 TRINITY_DN2610_c0_g1_i3:26-1360(-)